MTIFTVRKDGSGTHTEIQAAIFDAQQGDTIDIGAGTFEENIDLYKGVTLEGAGQEQSIIQGALETSVLRTFTCTLGSTTLTMAAGTAGLKKGRLISGTGIPANTRIVSVSANSIVISAATTAARATPTSATMATVEATIRVRGSGASIKKLKIVGFDSPSAASEMAAVFYRNTGAGSAAASNQLIEDCWLVADGEYCLLTDAIASVSNLTIQNNKFSGKTFVGANPATGNQFSVPNVPRQLVTIQSANVGVTFSGNLIEGTTGGLTVDGVASFNTAATIDPAGAVVSNNTVKTASGYGYGIRARGANAVVSGNKVFAFGAYSSSGFLISGAGATNQNNSLVNQPLVAASQASSGAPVSVQMTKELVLEQSKVASSPVFSNESNWKLVTWVFKKQGGSKRLVASFRNFAQAKAFALRSGMQSGDVFQLQKIIVSTSNRAILVLKRNEIADATNYDITLA